MALMYLRRARLPLIAATLALAMASTISYGSPLSEPLRAPLAVIVVFLAGYLLVRALFGYGLDTAEALALSASLGISIAILSALALNYALGINERSSALAYTAITLLASLMAARGSARGARPGLFELLQALLPLALALSLRLYPTLSTGLPFSNDAWSPISYARYLLESSPTPLDSSWKFDQPGIALYGALLSALTGLDAARAMSLLVPAAGALSALGLYAIASRLSGRKAALVASILFASSFTDVILTSGVKGETLARPLYISLILLSISEAPFPRRALLISVIGLSLALAHYYTAALAASMLAFSAIAIIATRRGMGPRGAVAALAPPLIVWLEVLGFAYFYAGWQRSVLAQLLGDWRTALICNSALLALALLLSRARVKRGPALALAASAALAYIILTRQLVPGAPAFPPRYIVYMSPFIAMAAAGSAGAEALKEGEKWRAALLISWLASVLAVEAYAVFGNIGDGLKWAIAYRSINYLIPPLSIMCGAGIARLSGGGPRRAALAISIVAAILALNLYGLQGALFSERYMGYFWLYRPPEYRAGEWLSERSNTTIACDVKYSWMLRNWFGLRANEWIGYSYLAGRSKARPSLLIVYDQMSTHGYVIGWGYGADLPDNWAERAGALNLVYSNGVTEVYSG